MVNRTQELKTIDRSNSLDLMQSRKKLLTFVKYCHAGQRRKYGNEWYWTHLQAVADLIIKYLPEETPAYEIALCHDLLEDTDCKASTIFDQLVYVCGNTKQLAEFIVLSVKQLTDKYTPEAYPALNRTIRKQKEAARLGMAGPITQTVKYADLIHNTSTIVKYDKEFAKIYLKEKMLILDKMRSGDIRLYVECCYSLRKAIDEVAKWERQK